MDGRTNGLSLRRIGKSATLLCQPLNRNVGLAEKVIFIPLVYQHILATRLHFDFGKKSKQTL